ncbi:MAG: hypothetical protein ABWY00_08385 [Dongiaceae bacterium]
MDKSRREYEQKALDIVAGRTGQRPAAAIPKSNISGVAMLSIWLWIAAIAVVGAVVAYVFLWK